MKDENNKNYWSYDKTKNILIGKYIILNTSLNEDLKKIKETSINSEIISKKNFNIIEIFNALLSFIAVIIYLIIYKMIFFGLLFIIIFIIATNIIFYPLSIFNNINNRLFKYLRYIYFFVYNIFFILFWIYWLFYCSKIALETSPYNNSIVNYFFLLSGIIGLLIPYYLFRDWKVFDGLYFKSINSKFLSIYYFIEKYLIFFIAIFYMILITFPSYANLIIKTIIK